MTPQRYTRRTVLRAGGGMVALTALSPTGLLLQRATAAGMRGPGSLPDPSRPAGVATDALPFDHIVVVMQENHSFDNYFGMLSRRGAPSADGFSFDASGNPTNSNPVDGGYITAQRAPTRCQPGGVSQSWAASHKEIDGGAMDGFARVAKNAMLYWDEQDIPFYYSLAKTFALGNRYFCSVPAQTYPNRRFLLAATAFGLVSTDTSTLTQDPPAGTIFDRLDAHGISWRNYFTDIPATGVIASIPAKHPANLASVNQFALDCQLGNLPAVSFVDSDIGVVGEAGGGVSSVPVPFANDTGRYASTLSETEENPADITLGENFVSRIVNALVQSPSFARTLLVWTYDEHGGYYDHVPPPAAIPPDTIKPILKPSDPPGGYDLYGPRVPTVVVSPYAKAGTVDTVCDHTSILATIEAKWNLPAITYRDANANTLASFLDTKVRFNEPPKLAAPADVGMSQSTCSTALPTFPVHASASGPATPAAPAAGHLTLRFYGRRHADGGAVALLRTTAGALHSVVVELRRGTHVVARTTIAKLGAKDHRTVLKARHGEHLTTGHYRLVVKHGKTTLADRDVRLRP